MVYAFPVFENGKCKLRFRNTKPEPVTLKKIVIRQEPFIGGAVPQILNEDILLPPNREVEYEITNSLIKYLPLHDPQKHRIGMHFDLTYEPKDDAQPEGLYWIQIVEKKITGFGSE
jgi:hypothetical protein